MNVPENTAIVALLAWLLCATGVAADRPTPGPTQPRPAVAGSPWDGKPVPRPGDALAELPPVDFRDEIIYWAMTDRFANGDASNDNGDLSRPGDTGDPANPLGWHGGDFAGIEQKIEAGYFQAMGFTAIWISPVVLQVPPTGNGGGPNQNQIFTSYHGYWAEDFLQIEPHFGTLDDLRSLVNTARQHGVEILIDAIVNHAGYGATLVDVHPEWFRTGGECGGDEITQCLAGLPDFIQDNAEARQYLFDSVRFLRDELGMAGLRMDTMKHVSDDFWVEFFSPGGAGDPARVWTVGEVFDGSVDKLARYVDELGSPSVFDFPLHFAIVGDIARGSAIASLADVFAQDYKYADPTRLTLFIDNHDVKRFVSEAIGAGADRPEALTRLDAALTLIYTARGLPMVYYGTEIGMTGEGDPYALPLASSSREDMQFDALDESDIDERLRALAKARIRYPVLRRGTQRTLWPTELSGCDVPDSGLDPTEAFGAELFLRGSFNGWAATPGDGNVVNLDGTLYAAAIDMSSGFHEYKIAAGDWSVELGVVEGPTLLDMPQPIGPLMGGPEGNAEIDTPESGCHRWEIDVSDPELPLLTVTRVGGGTTVLAFVREMAGESPVVVVLNNGDSDVDLATLPGGGLPVTDILGDGPAAEITRQGGGFAVSGGRLTGTVARRSVRAVAQP